LCCRTHSTIAAEHFAAQFFDLWYCENGLPLDIISDHNKLFISKFWKALVKLTGVKLKMLSSYHPETDGSSKCTNKSVVQSLCFHVKHNQKGWVKKLLLVCFNLMNTVNISMSFSPFQLYMGHSPQLILPILPTLANKAASELDSAYTMALIEHINLDVAKVKDNLLAAKVSQTEFVNRHRGDEITYFRT
jgi:hypothetical protein